MASSGSVGNVIRWTAVAVICIAVYTALFAPCVTRYPGFKVIESVYCRGRFQDCDKSCFFDIDSTFCVIVAQNCTFAVRNASFVQVGQLLYSRSSITPVNGTIENATSIVSLAQRC